MTLAAGTRLGPYEVSAPLGAGGMGEVYRARDTRLEREVALKVLPESLLADPQSVERFVFEAKATGQLNHPNILAVFDLDMNPPPYVVTEYLTGETLHD